MQEKLAGYFALLLYAAGTVGLVWLCVRFILPWAAPFITAYLLAALLEKPVGYLSRAWLETGRGGGAVRTADACAAFVGGGLARTQGRRHSHRVHAERTGAYEPH